MKVQTNIKAGFSEPLLGVEQNHEYRKTEKGGGLLKKGQTPCYVRDVSFPGE